MPDNKKKISRRKKEFTTVAYQCEFVSQAQEPKRE